VSLGVGISGRQPVGDPVHKVSSVPELIRDDLCDPHVVFDDQEARHPAAIVKLKYSGGR
jgi:hypothetical protein